MLSFSASLRSCGRTEQFFSEAGIGARERDVDHFEICRRVRRTLDVDLGAAAQQRRGRRVHAPCRGEHGCCRVQGRAGYRQVCARPTSFL